MKFLVDAQLPYRMIEWLAAAGHDAIHTRDLPNQNRTDDADICNVADRDSRVVISKDADFVNSHLISGRPKHLLLISAGNLANRELLALMKLALPIIEVELQANTFVELGSTGIIVRG